jgi:hypothetical protein
VFPAAAVLFDEADRAQRDVSDCTFANLMVLHLVILNMMMEAS